MAMIRDKFLRLKDDIASLCGKIGRNPSEITLIGVTKFATADHIKEAVEAGLEHIGENKVQVAKEKFPTLDQWGLNVTKHMIGHLQSNKAKHALELFDFIHSVDSLKLAEEIDKQALKLNKKAKILIQVSTSGEEQKFGIDPDAVFAIVEGARALKNVETYGLMTIAPLTQDEAIVRQCFRDLRVLKENIEKNYPKTSAFSMQYLSMGMTQDYKIALEEGSNMLRIGSAIFA
jgi:pyridoxal phosphate enzyme (YggS family)